MPRLIEHNEFDTIYHEHFSYYTLMSAERVLAAHGLTSFDVEELPTHGGSFRLHVRHHDRAERPVTGRVVKMRAARSTAGFDGPEGYAGFAEQRRSDEARAARFLIDARARGSSVAGYGAPGKGNTLLNYCGIRTDLLAFTVDRNPYKHGRFLPGTHIPVYAARALAGDRGRILC